MTTLYLNIVFSAVCLLLSSGHAQRCPDDWVHFEESCYLFIDEIVSWTSAEVYCRILRAKMLEVETRRENDFVAAQLRAKPGLHAVWQGANDFVREGRWVFNSNGQPLTWLNWHQGEPNNSDVTENGEDCIQIYPDGTWDDNFCEYLTGPSPVCEMNAIQDVIG